jgi:hypothetical protein
MENYREMELESGELRQTFSVGSSAGRDGAFSERSDKPIQY